MKRLTILILLTPFLAACGSTGSTANNATSTQETTGSTPEPEPDTEASETGAHTTSHSEQHEPPSHAVVTGFAATESAWNATHTPDHEGNLDPNAVYNPNPSLPEVNGHTGAEYTQVLHSDGHMTGYEYHTTNMPIEAIRTKCSMNSFLLTLTRYGLSQRAARARLCWCRAMRSDGNLAAMQSVMAPERR